MFPEYQSEIQEISKTSQNSKGKSFLFDFEKGEFKTIDGKVVSCEGVEALKVWISKVLKTEKFKFKVYENTEYGITIEDFIRSDYDFSFITTELEREIKEALLEHQDIKSVHSFNFERVKRGIQCTFTTETVYGEIESEVNVI